MGWGTWSRYAREHPSTSEARLTSATQAEVVLSSAQASAIQPGMRGFISHSESPIRIMGRVDALRPIGDQVIVHLSLVSPAPSEWLGQPLEAVIDTLRPFDDTSP